MKDKIAAILVDDEQKSRKGLRNLLSRFCPEVELCGEAGDIDEAYELILEKKPDLVFLDIQMPDGNGFGLLKKIENIWFDVIFVTGFDEYAINAIKFSALDYLLKPVEVTDLVSAVKKALNKKGRKLNNHTQIINLLNIAEADVIEKKIVVHLNEKAILIRVDSIYYIEADGRYCHITTSTGTRYVLTKTLKEFEEFFADNRVFVRVGKSVMLNVNYIKSYTKSEPSVIEMQDGKGFEVSRRKKQEVLDRIKK